MIILEDIRKHMLDYMGYDVVIDFGDDIGYEDTGHCSDFLWNEIKRFWEDFKTDEDFKYLVSCEWLTEGLDLDGGRDYILSCSEVIPLIFDYMYNTLGWRHNDYKKVIYNSTELTDELQDMFDNISVIRDNKIEEILKK